MKIFLIISTLLAFFIASIFAYGFSLNQQVEIGHSLVLEAPDVVVWNAATKFDDHHKWQKSITALYNYNNSARQVRYLLGDKTIMANQQVRVRENATTIDFIQIGMEEYTKLKNIGGQISVKRLADGNTELGWKITYTAESVMDRLIDKFFVQPKLKQLLSKNLRSLKSYIED